MKLEHEIAKYFYKCGLDVTGFKEIKSIDELPGQVGEYILTPEIKKELKEFLSYYGGKHMLVETEDQYGMYIARTSNNKVTTSKNVFALLNRSYHEYNKKTLAAESMLETIDSELEEELASNHDMIKEDTYLRFQRDLSTAITMLDEATLAIERLALATKVYVPKNLIVQEGADKIKRLKEKNKDLTYRVDLTETFSEEPDGLIRSGSGEY